MIRNKSEKRTMHDHTKTINFCKKYKSMEKPEYQRYNSSISLRMCQKYCF